MGGRQKPRQKPRVHGIGKEVAHIPPLGDDPIDGSDLGIAVTMAPSLHFTVPAH
ncbi:MAG: hypothetical protein KatS3mg123_0739 [Burkholderiales bacterium]|nr:MAG: hypothetical protein KatS3mg123_0739 [Burkholderiales bacterium]